jgi:hypothetical protein
MLIYAVLLNILLHCPVERWRRTLHGASLWRATLHPHPMRRAELQWGVSFLVCNVGISTMLE